MECAIVDAMERGELIKVVTYEAPRVILKRVRTAVEVWNSIRQNFLRLLV